MAQPTQPQPLPPGTPAPPFTLKVTPDQTSSLSDFSGSRVVVIFYPADLSPVCSDELLFDNQDDLELPALHDHARQLRLDHRRFAAELEDHTHLARIRRDFLGGVRSGVSGTPAFFINSLKHEGSYSYEGLREAIEGGVELNL